MFVNIEPNNTKKNKIDNKIRNNTNSSNNTNNPSHNDIYDINNFFSCAIKIREKSISHNVICPSFEELPPSFFEDNNIEVSIFYLFIIIIIYRIMKIPLMKLI